ncbi:MAG: acyl-ACP--UDP-N-acetylglucosamine O-acyltransferase [bacterium]
MNCQIHPTAIVDPGVKLGKDIIIGAYTIIGPNVQIGDECVIGDHSHIVRNTVLGKGCRIYHYSAVGGDPQDLKFRNEETWLEVGDGAIIREFVTINRGTIASGKTIIGNNTVLLAYAHVAHDCRVGSNVILSNAVQLGGHVTIQDFVIIGGGTVVHQFTKVGEHAMIGGGFRIIMDVLPFSMAGSEPLKIHGVNKIGLERRGFTPSAIKEIKKAFRIFFRMGLTRDKAIEKIKADCEYLPEINRILVFIEGSSRGLVR